MLCIRTQRRNEKIGCIGILPVFRQAGDQTLKTDGKAYSGYVRPPPEG